MNNEFEQESLSSGVPDNLNDLDTIWKQALDYKTNDGSKETNSSSDPCDGDSSSQATKKFTVKWTASLESQFYKAVEHIGVQKATPKKILEFMNLKFLTRAHIASRLQKYRQTLKRARYLKFSSEGDYINPQHSYNYNTRLDNNNLFSIQPRYGLGQSSPMMYSNAGLNDSLNHKNHRPAYDLSQTGSKLFPRRGSLGFQNGMLPLKEEWRSISRTSQAPRFGQYGTSSNVGIDGVRVNSNGNGSFDGSFGDSFGMNMDNDMSNHGSSTFMFPSALSSFLDNKDQSQNNLTAQIDSVVPTLENPKIFDDHHGINEAFNDTINSQFDQNQQQGNMTGENFEVPSAYLFEGINNWSYNDGNNYEEISNSLVANPEMYFPTQDMNITNQDNNNEEILNSLAANPEMYFPTQDMNITNHGNNNEEILNSLAANLKMHFPTYDMNFSNQENNNNNNEEILNSLAANPVMYFPTHQDMDITNHGHNAEEILNSLDANREMYFPTENVNITNQEHGFVDSTGLPLSFHQNSDDEDFLNYLLDPDRN